MIFTLRHLALFVSCTFCIGLASCATTHPATGRTPTASHTEIICGKMALLVPDFLEGCPNGSGACASFDGQHWVLQYPSGDPVVLAHEKEHACGMEHREPWVDIGLFGSLRCVEVTAGGQTLWTASDVMCRGISGDIYKETDPARIDRVRHLQHQARPTDLKPAPP